MLYFCGHLLHEKGHFFSHSHSTIVYAQIISVDDMRNSVSFCVSEKMCLFTNKKMELYNSARYALYLSACIFNFQLKDTIKRLAKITWKQQHLTFI